MFFPSRKSRVVILDKRTDPKVKKGEKISLILTPDFYWTSIEKLEIDRKKAKKAAASVFEGIVPDGREYIYYVSKDDKDGAYLFYAIEKDLVLDRIAKITKKGASVNEIYLAHEVAKKISLPAKIGRYIAEKTDSGIKFLPADIAGIKYTGNIRKTEKDIVEIPNGVSKIDIEKKPPVKPLLITAFIALAVFGSELIYSYHILLETEKMKEEVRKNYGLPPTMLQTDSILSKLKQTEKTQRDAREILSKTASYLYDSNAKIEKLRLDVKKNTLEIKFSEKEGEIEKIAEQIRKSKTEVKNVASGDGKTVIRIEWR